MVKYKSIDWQDIYQIHVVTAYEELSRGLELRRGRLLHFFYRVLIKLGRSSYIYLIFLLSISFYPQRSRLRL